MSSTAPNSVIHLQALRFTWPNQSVPVLDIKNLQISPRERVFIKGPSGSGKSTLLNLLGGVLTPQTGEINLLGQSLIQMRPAARDRFRADHIGFIFQLFNLLPYLSVLDNVLLPLHFSPRRHQRVLGQSDIQTEAERLLQHLDLSGDLLHRPVTELSVGQQQRVAAARALIGQPEIVIADEPTSALDTQRRHAFIELLIHECELAGSTLVFVSHDDNLAESFDRCIALDRINQTQINQTDKVSD